jgi:sterol desaturase/sphingolipid hydroxylase (fatty acid hydroxylase superfamily)
MTVLRSALRVSYVPAMLLGWNALAYAVVMGGLSWGWLLPVLITAFLSAYVAEHILPAHEEWNHDQGDTKTNWFHNLYYENSVATGVVMIPFLVWLFPVTGVWPTEWPTVVQLLLAILFADTMFTLVHYFSHRWPLLWRLHAVHHGVGRLTSFNGLVRHPLHQSIDMVVGTLPLVLLGMPVDIAVLLGFAISIQLIVQHSNVDYALGPARHLLSIGKAHHLHHVNWGTEGDCNFGLFFTHVDRMLGTFVLEPSREIQANDLGIDELPQFPKSYLSQLLLPFYYVPGQGLPEKFKPKGLSNNAATNARRMSDDTRQRLSPAE